MTEYIILEPAPTAVSWQEKPTRERMRERYRAQRTLWAGRTGKLTMPGKQQAYMWICGYLQGSHDELNIQWDQNPIYMLCHARGPDFAMGLTEQGDEL